MFPRTAVIIAGLLVVSLAVAFLLGPERLFRPMRAQMATGSEYMKSLSEADIKQWITRTEKLLSEYQPGSNSIGVYGQGAKPIPPDLQKLKIIRIDILEDQVRYVWMGGLDHTELEVDRLSDGSFKFIAHYNDQKSEVIWPRATHASKSNQAMQRTASRAAFHLSGVCHPPFGYEARFTGLAVADLVSR
jgi:hypothetical protein